MEFKKQWPNDKIGFSKFCDLKLKWCITLVCIRYVFAKYTKTSSYKCTRYLMPIYSQYMHHLKLKWCITVNSFGMHSVCVCQIHQNIQLQMHAILHANIGGKPDPTCFKYLLSLMGCDVENQSCMLRSCPKCPGVELLKQHIAARAVARTLIGGVVYSYTRVLP